MEKLRKLLAVFFVGFFGIFQTSCRQIQSTSRTNLPFKTAKKKTSPSRPFAGNMARDSKHLTKNDYDTLDKIVAEAEFADGRKVKEVLESETASNTLQKE